MLGRLALLALLYVAGLLVGRLGRGRPRGARVRGHASSGRTRVRTPDRAGRAGSGPGTASGAAPARSVPPGTGSSAAKAPATRVMPAPTPELPPVPAGTNDADDDLRRIRGIGPANERRLAEAGVTRFAQIAAWTPDEAAAMGERLSFGGRVEREDWVGQARTLAGGGATDPGRKDAAGAPSMGADDPRGTED